MQDPTIPIERLYEEFYKELDTTLTLHDITQICRAPWRVMRKIMISDEIHFFRFKYFGIFRTTPLRVTYLKKLALGRYNAGSIDRDEYKRQTKICQDFLDRE